MIDLTAKTVSKHSGSTFCGVALSGWFSSTTEAPNVSAASLLLLPNRKL